MAGHHAASCLRCSGKCSGTSVKCNKVRFQSLYKNPRVAVHLFSSRGGCPESTDCVAPSPVTGRGRGFRVKGVKRVSARPTGVSRCTGRTAAAWFAVSAVGGGTKGQEAQARPSGPTRTLRLDRDRDVFSCDLIVIRYQNNRIVSLFLTVDVDM